MARKGKRWEIEGVKPTKGTYVQRSQWADISTWNLPVLAEIEALVDEKVEKFAEDIQQTITAKALQAGLQDVVELSEEYDTFCCMYADGTIDFIVPLGSTDGEGPTFQVPFKQLVDEIFSAYSYSEHEEDIQNLKTCRDMLRTLVLEADRLIEKAEMVRQEREKDA